MVFGFVMIYGWYMMKLFLIFGGVCNVSIYKVLFDLFGKFIDECMVLCIFIVGYGYFKGSFEGVWCFVMG